MALLVNATDRRAKSDYEIKSWLGKGSEKIGHHVSFGVDHLSNTYAISGCIYLSLWRIIDLVK